MGEYDLELHLSGGVVSMAKRDESWTLQQRKIDQDMRGDLRNKISVRYIPRRIYIAKIYPSRMGGTAYGCQIMPTQ